MQNYRHLPAFSDILPTEMELEGILVACFDEYGFTYLLSYCVCIH